MARVRTEDTTPEMVVRRLLFSLGYRYRLHVKTLPGRPDLVFSRLGKIIFVNGCFWHGHNCTRGRRPSSNRDFWEPKLSKNKERDQRTVGKLSESGWNVLTVWECETHNIIDLKAKLVEFLSISEDR
jgi:DNA mismatch endonuclease (patch repair protein)